MKFRFLCKLNEDNRCIGTRKTSNLTDKVSPNVIEVTEEEYGHILGKYLIDGVWTGENIKVQIARLKKEKELQEKDILKQINNKLDEIKNKEV